MTKPDDLIFKSIVKMLFLKNNQTYYKSEESRLQTLMAGIETCLRHVISCTILALALNLYRTDFSSF